MFSTRAIGLFLALVTCVPVAHAIIGGSSASIGEYPFTVAWVDSEGKQFCSGSLITNQHVLTAASCFVDISGYSKYIHRDGHAFVGEASLASLAGSSHDIAFVSIHPSYNPVNFAYHPSDLVDIAVVRLETHVEMGQTHLPTNVVLGSAYSQRIIDASNPRHAISWGRSKNTDTVSWNIAMQYLVVDPENSGSTCMGDATKFKPGEVSPFDPVTQICVVTKSSSGACAGDSGAPLITFVGTAKTEKYQFGLFSGLAPSTTKWECARQTNSDGNKNWEVYTNVVFFGSWIQEHTNTILPFKYAKKTAALKPIQPNPHYEVKLPANCGPICGDQALSGLCWCDISCEQHGDCCPDFDFQTKCLNTLPAPARGPGSCADLKYFTSGKAESCGFKSGTCWCDAHCTTNGDCCPDYDKVCGILGGGQDSCVDNCGRKSGTCWCDASCSKNGDCCLDYQICSSMKGGTGSCQDNCGRNAGHCWCDAGCLSNGDCCSNFQTQCGNTGSCNGNCGKNAGDCWCDMQCKLDGTCCDDMQLYCPHVDVFTYQNMNTNPQNLIGR